jgi:outer membrane lipoprotein-sorting protein
VQFLRRISTKQLALLCAAVLAVAGGGTALAVAATSGGTAPKQQALANAVHDAATAPKQDGVTATFTYTNHLIDGVDIHGANPLLAGGDGRIWASKDGHFRLELKAGGNTPDSQIVSDGKSFWIYDGSSNTVYRGTMPQHAAEKPGEPKKKAETPPTVAQIQQKITQLMQHLNLSDPPQAGTTAGQPSYTVSASPKQHSGLLGQVQLAWDAIHGAPLRVAVYPKGSTSPVLELTVNNITYGAPDSSAFNITPPAGAKTQSISSSNKAEKPAADKAAAKARKHKEITGLAAVQKKVGFQLAAPSTLDGKQRQGVKLLGHDGAVVTYGQGLDGIAVIQQKAGKAGAGATGNGALGRRAELPTVSINGTSAQELSTPLGTVLRFERGGVRYTVLASAPKAVVEAAARGL